MSQNTFKEIPIKNESDLIQKEVKFPRLTKKLPKDGK